MRLTAAVIGLGQVGLEYDYERDSDDDTYVLTHASGFRTHPNYDLVAGVDVNKSKCQLFHNKYQLPTFASIQELLQYQKPDVISIAVPTEFHYEACQEALKGKPRAIICEKPFGHSPQLAKKLIHDASKNNCTLLINYMRRFEPGTKALKELLNKGGIGSVRQIIVRYSKGLFTNGCHFIDLLQFLFGELSEVNLLLNKVNAYADPAPDFYCKINTIDVYFINCEVSYALDDIYILGSSGVTHYLQGGESIMLQKALPHSIFSNISSLSNEFTTIPNDILRYQWHTCEYLYRYLLDKKDLSFNTKSAYQVLQTIENIVNRMNKHE